MRSFRSILWAFLLAVSMSAVSGVALAGEAKDELLFHWDVKFDSGQTSVISRSGELARLTLKDGRAYAVSAVMEDGGGPAVTFRVLTVKEVPEAGEMLKQVEKFTLLPGATYSTAFKPALAFHLDKVTKVTAAGEQEPVGADRTASSLDAVVTWEVSTAAQKSVRFVGRDGETASIQIPGSGTWEITPSIRDSNQVDFSIVKVGVGDAETRSTDRFTLKVGSLHPAPENSGFTVKLTSVRQSG